MPEWIFRSTVAHLVSQPQAQPTGPYTWTPLVQGEITIKSHAFDDTGNIEALTTSQNTITITITEPVAPICPCTIWPSSINPTNITENDNNSYELGVKFRSNVNGYITGVRIL